MATEYNIEEIVQAVLARMAAISQAVGELRTVTSLEGLVSLPALTASKTEVVDAPLTLLSKPAVDAAAAVQAKIAEAQEKITVMNAALQNMQALTIETGKAKNEAISATTAATQKLTEMAQLMQNCQLLFDGLDLKDTQANNIIAKVNDITTTAESLSKRLNNDIGIASSFVSQLQEWAEAERQRELSEQNRDNEEQKRKTGEQSRISAENLRTSAENNRDSVESQRVAEFTVLKRQSQEATADAIDTASHPTYIGEDFYVYKWDKGTASYTKTNIFVKGEGFSIAKVFGGITEMEAAGGAYHEGVFVMITTNPEDEDNAKLYIKTETGWEFLTDMSGARGFEGKTPQLSIGTVLTSNPGTDASISLVPNGEDAKGNPRLLLNVTIPRGNNGLVPTLNIGTVITGIAGSEATAEIIPAGTEIDGRPKYTLNFVIPRGDTGSLASGDAKGLTVTFPEASVRTNVISGESLAVLFGKIKKWFSDLKTVAFTGKFADLTETPTTLKGYGIIDASSSNHNHEGVYEPKFDKKGAFNKDFGNVAGSVCQGNDSRLSDARTPVAHTHNYAGSSSAGGSASSADKLSTAHKINGVAFDGTKDITIEAGGVDSLPVNTILESTVQADNIFGSKWLKCDGSIVYKADYPSLKLPGAGLSNWAASNSMYGQSCKIICINGIFLSCGSSGVCCWSTDGKTWTRGSGFDTTTYYYGIAYGNGVYVLVGGSRRAYWSADGKSWSACVGFYIDSDNSIGDITYGNGVFVCIDSAGFAYSSTDGKSWLKVGEFGIRTDPHITYGNGLFVCACSSSVIYYSTDGRSWRQGSGLVSGYHRSVAYGNGIFVTVGHEGVTCFSTDGKSWMKATAFEDKNMFAITWGGGLFVAVGSAGTSFHSVDGKTWVTGSSLINTERYFFAVGYGNGMFVCCDAAGLSYWCVQLTGQIILPNRESSFIKALE